MDLGVEAGVFTIYAAAIATIFLLGRILLIPIKVLLKLVVNSAVGGVFLILLNTAGAASGIVMPVNIITAVIAGLLGLPGVAGLVIFFNGFA